MRHSFTRLFVLCLLVMLPGVAWGQRGLSGTAEIHQSLMRLKTLGRVLMIAAHPDDENTAALAYFARGRHMDTAYLSLTRGEGGQNLIGPELGPMLGLIRTQELLAARKVDGARQYFSRAVDFGFSKTADETLAKWGRDEVLADTVWVIRSFQPDIVILRFSGTPRDGHGHHQSSAIIGREAFRAAADPARFPGQLQWVKPWQAKRLFFNVFAWSTEDEAAAAKDGRNLSIDTGEFNPILGHSYAEIAGMSRSEHRSQAMGSPEPKGAAKSYFTLLEGERASAGLMEGIDTTWKSIPGGGGVGQALDEALRAFRPDAPHEAIPHLLEARTRLAGLEHPRARAKLQDLDETLALCAGLWLEATAETPQVVPGHEVLVRATAVNRSAYPLRLESLSLLGLPEAAAFQEARGNLEANKPLTAAQPVSIPRDFSYTQPYWLEKPPDGALYHVPKQQLLGLPEGPAPLQARFLVRFGGQTLEYLRPLEHRRVDAIYGERRQPLEIVPPVSVQIPAGLAVFPEAGPRTVEVLAQANMVNASGDVSLRLPEGWRVEPATREFKMERLGQQASLSFTVHAPAQPSTGIAQAVASIGNVQVRSTANVLSYPHIPVRTALLPAEARMVREDIRLLARRIGYIMGAGDEIPQALRQLGAEVVLLEDHQIARANLAGYDAIVAGVRAFNVRPALVANISRVLDYVHNGGTFVSQYNVLEFFRRMEAGRDPLAKIGPYPIKVGRRRVSMEEAPVAFTNPDDPLLHKPNKIRPEDFDGWVQERGLYFAEEWDPNYRTLFSAHDPGEPPAAGGTLYAPYGRGVYVFTAYSWFRQLPAGVPGAFRIFANLLSAGKTVAGNIHE